MGMVWVETCTEQLHDHQHPVGCEGTLYPQRPDSTVVAVIWHTDKLLTTSWASGDSSNTFLTEQVATTGLNWMQHHLKADRTLQSLQVLLCLFHKQVLLAFVREREPLGGGHFVGVPGRETIPLVMNNVNIQATPPNNRWKYYWATKNRILFAQVCGKQM